MTELGFVLPGLFLIALLYSVVGHGGASGYLAILSLTTLSIQAISSTSLLLNLFVAGLSFAFYAQAKNFSWRLTWPFLVSAIPLAFLGASIAISPDEFSIILGCILLLASVRLFFKPKSSSEVTEPASWKALSIGGVIGFLSGLVGVGGGIFLSPILIFFGWADPKKAAATSSIFIFCNSISGLAGRVVNSNIIFADQVFWMIIVCVGGSLIGGYFGANKIAHNWIRYALGLVLLTAAIKSFL